MNVLFTLGVVALAALWGVAVYNRLVGLRRQVRAAWTRLDAERARRHAAGQDLVEALKGSAVDADALAAAINARGRAADARGPADAARRDAELVAALDRLGTLADADPQLAASPRVRGRRDGLAAVATAVDEARQAYNAVAAKYNGAIEAVPGNLVAAVAGFHKAELF